MPRKSRQGNALFYILAIVGIIGALVFLITDDGRSAGALKYNLSFTDIGGDQVDVECKIKQTLTVIDISGNTIAVVESPGIVGSPSFNLLNPSDNREVSTFVIIPKIWCATLGSDITVEKSDLRLVTEVGSMQQTQNIRYQTELKFSTDGGDSEKNLGWFSLSDNDIEAMIPERDFSGVLEFHVMGNVDIHYDNYPSNTMTIPIGKDDLRSTWGFKNQGVNETIVDSDGDGIMDNADACPSSSENYNGYKDSDGCPDKVPNSTSTPVPQTNTEPVTKLTCNADNKTWYTNNSNNDFCGVKYIQSDNQFCKEFSQDSKQCIDPVDTVDVVDTDSIPASIKFQVDVKYNDNSKDAFQVQDDPSPFEVDIPLSLSGGTGGAVKRIAEFTVEPRIVFSDSKFHSLVSVTKSNITIEPIITHSEVDYSLGKMPVRFVPSNGGSVSDNSVGLSLGEIVVKATNLENKVPLKAIPIDSSGIVDTKFLVDGEIELTGGDGTVTVRPVDITGADFDLVGMKIIRGSPPSSGGVDPGVTCDPDTEYLKALSGGGFECVPNGATGEDQDIPQIGQPGVEICIDDKRPGGFPCSEDYRNTFCDGTTDCGNVGNDDSEIFLDLDGDGKIDGNDLPGEDECPVDLTPVSVLDSSVCVVPTHKFKGESGEQSPLGGLKLDTNLMLIGGVAIVGLIVVAVAIGHKRQAMPYQRY